MVVPWARSSLVHYRHSPQFSMDTHTPDALKVASHILWIADLHGRHFTPMQLLKVSYISHGWSLGLCDRPLFKDHVEAWKYGPVIPDVYHKYKRFGYSHIKVRTKDLRESLGKISHAIMDRVVEVYGKYDGLYLSSLTHQPDSPWDITIKERGEGAIIPNDVIKDYYRKLSQLDEQGA